MSPAQAPFRNLCFFYEHRHVDASQANQTFVDALGRQSQEVTLDAGGDGVFTCDGGSVSVWVRKEAAAQIRKIQ